MPNYEFKENITPESMCSQCGHPFDRASSIGPEQQPKPGNLSVCIRCNAVGIFNPDLTVRRPTDEEQREIDEDSYIQSVLLSFAEAKKHIRKVN